MNLDLKGNKKHRLAAITTLASLLGVAVIVIAGVSYAYAYTDRFFPGSTVAHIPLAGLSYDEGLALVNSRAALLIEEGADITINGSTRTIPLRLISPDDPDLSQDLVVLTIQPAIQEAFNKGRTGNLAIRTWDMVHTGLARPNNQVGVETNIEAIEASLLEMFREYYDPAQEPKFAITKEGDLWTIDVVDGKPGRAFDLDYAVNAFTTMMANLNNDEVIIAVIDEEPSIDTSEAKEQVEQVNALLLEAPFTLIYEVNRFETHTYELTDDILASSLQVSREQDGNVQLQLNSELDLFATLQEDINIEARNARFSMENNRAQEFRPSLEGRKVNMEATLATVTERLNRTTVSVEVDDVLETTDEEADVTDDTLISIIVENTEPEITTSEVNDLGITEILGIGTSDYSRSPANRIHNIANATAALNGMLIPPGGEFSLVDALEPITQANGYLPELVIKGDEIIPEVGGGLCQIGTTSFRAAMHSGLAITERRNHSLVVSYYNDPSNGNPGTDATIYGPHPDFRFVNDTENYVLFMAENDVDNRMLTYTYWGTNDGRKGYYSPPVVHNWIPAGATQTTYTTDYEPGYKKCQGAHSGANTSFTYYIERADGDVDEKLFESYYRPLPTICIEGVAPEQLDPDGNLVEIEEEPEEIMTEAE